jgi:hypothetical protein
VTVQLTRPPDSTPGAALRVPRRGRVVVEGRLPADDDGAPYPAAGGWFWDLLLEEKLGPAARG